MHGDPDGDPRRDAGVSQMFSKRGAKGSGALDMPETVEQASMGSEGYPKDFAVGALRERRLLMALRSMGIALSAAIIVVIVQAFLLVSLFPLKEIRPFLVQVSNEGSVVASIKPIQDTFEAKDILTEKLVREYVINRHEILRSDVIMQERWGADFYLGVTTERDEYRRFREQVTPVLTEIRQQGAARRAEILSVSAVRVGEVYIVDFRSTSYDQNDKIVDERIYTATLEVDFRSLNDLTREQMLINPTGFTVVNYSLAEKDQ